MEETLKTLKEISKSFEQFMGSLEKTTQRINRIHNLVDEKIGMISTDTHEMIEFIKKEDEKSNQLIKDLVEKTVNEIGKLYEYFELNKLKNIISNLDREIKFPDLEQIASIEELKSALSQIKEIYKFIKEK